MRVNASGSRSSRIAIVGEAPGVEEEQEGLPFIGASGEELTRMLRDARIEREACFITNVCQDRPHNNDISLWIDERKTQPGPDWIQYRGKWVKPFVKDECERLYQELRSVNPNVVLACGNTPLWALCKEEGVAKWRGSHLESNVIPNLKVIPTYHPAAILRQYSWRPIGVEDMRRAQREAITPMLHRPDYYFAVKPSFREVRAYLDQILNRLRMGQVPLTCDLEIFHKEILCVGIGISRTTAICIPFLSTKGWYWTLDEHWQVICQLREVLCHPNCQVINQNLSFDIQYLFWRFYMRPKAHFDTMIAQNVLFSGMPKDLAFLSSMYCHYHRYWKDDGKFWINFNDEELWNYNCIDCVSTFEIAEVQQKALVDCGLVYQMAFQMRVFEHLMGMMIKGVKVDLSSKKELLGEINTLVDTLHNDVKIITQSDLTGPKGDFSPAKMATLFYKHLGIKAQWKAGGGLTCDDEALKKIAQQHPWLRPLTERINMIRSYGTAADICHKRTDIDGRWRTNYNVAGTTTYRLASSSNPFDSGLNLQNLTSGRDINAD